MVVVSVWNDPTGSCVRALCPQLVTAFGRWSLTGGSGSLGQGWVVRFVTQPKSSPVCVLVHRDDSKQLLPQSRAFLTKVFRPCSKVNPSSLPGISWQQREEWPVHPLSQLLPHPKRGSHFLLNGLQDRRKCCQGKEPHEAAQLTG